MKKIILSATFAFALLATSNTFAQQGFGTNQPDKSAAVDIVSSKRGLLIPRISIANLDQAAPVHQPANALFVYNTNTATGEGFYYWERDDKTLPTPTTYTGKWVRFTSSVNEKDVIVAAGENVKVNPTISTDGLTTTYTVGVKGGAEGQVLVTKIDNTDPANPITTTEWVNPEEFVKDVINATNGLTYVPSTGVGVDNIIKLGGTLTENTVIGTVNGQTNPLDNRSLTIAGLETVTSAPFVMVMNADGLLQKMERSTLLDAKDLTTDGKIVIGNNTSTTQTLADAVLVATQLSIKENSLTAAEIATGAVTSDEILDGTIQVADIKAPGTTTDSSKGGTANQVMVTNANGDVSWIDQSALGNKDNYNFTLPLAKDAGTANTTGGLDYAVTIANANATTVGVVREADTDPTVNVVDGVLSVNLMNTTLSGDVTGPLNDTKVEAIQGTEVSATLPTAINNVLVYDNANQEWVPTELTGSHITGEALTSNSITVTPTSGTTNTALLEALNIEITPGTAEGQILTTVNTAAAGDPAVLSTNWATPNSLIVVDNGLKKVTNDVIHLGGDLIEPTEIKTDDINTLAISGLQPATEKETNKVIVSEGTNGILRTVERVITGTNEDVAANSNYSFFAPEVVLNITLPPTGDVTVKFPAAASAVGQVINIKIANTTESHTGYLNVLDTYGSMPYQGWIVKSNGDAWVIVGRN